MILAWTSSKPSKRLPWIFQKHLDFLSQYIGLFFRKCDQRSFNLESSPRYVIPGEETAVFVSRNLETNCRKCSNAKLEVQLSITFVKPKASPVALYNKRWTVDTTDLVEDSSRYQPSFGKLLKEEKIDVTQKINLKSVKHVVLEISEVQMTSKVH